MTNKKEVAKATLNKNNKLPSLEKLEKGEHKIKDILELSLILNSEPKKEWIMEHPIIKSAKYIPINITEHLLTIIFKKWWVEIKELKIIANSIVCIVRVNAMDPLDNKSIIWQDGVGAVPIRVDKGAGALDFNNIQSSSIQTGAPSAESYAIKDASEKWGRIFGKDINRKGSLDTRDTLGFSWRMENDEEFAKEQKDKKDNENKIKLQKVIEGIENIKDIKILTATLERLQTLQIIDNDGNVIEKTSEDLNYLWERVENKKQELLNNK